MNRINALHVPAALLLVICAAGTGCGKPGKEDVRRGVANAKAAFELAQTQPNKQAELDALATMNTPVTAYVMKHLPQGESFLNYQVNSCAAPFCVAIKTTGPLQYTIEGYADDIAHPLLTETVNANSR